MGRGLSASQTSTWMKPQPRWQGTVTGAPFSLLPLRETTREMWVQAATGTTGPRSRSLPWDGAWVLSKGCSGHPAERDSWFGEDRQAASSSLTLPEL